VILVAANAMKCSAIIIVQNGHHPNPVRALTPGADIVCDGTGLGTYFFDNTFKTEFPIGIIYVFRCP
jgi:hypothetical protein